MEKAFKDLHVLMPKEIHKDFLVKCKQDGITASQRVRNWVSEFLKGEKA